MHIVTHSVLHLCVTWVYPVYRYIHAVFDYAQAEISKLQKDCLEHLLDPDSTAICQQHELSPMY
jgi:hypothetical protein